MRLHFHEKPWDLYVAVGYTVVMAGVLLALGVGNVLAILLVLFVPGYVLVAALFPGSPTPKKPEIDWMERIALSFGLSIAVVPLLGLVLNFTPWGIRFAPIVVTISLFVIGVGYVAYWRRMRLQRDQRLSLTMNLAVPNWQDFTLLDRSLTTALAASIIVASGTLAYIALTHRPTETFSEFYLLGADGNPFGYPTSLNVSEPGTVILGIANHEAASARYTVRVDLVGIQIVYNATSGFNETVVVNRTTWSTFDVTLADGQNRTQQYTFRISDAGLWKVQFLLFKNGNLSSAYRELHLYLRVT